MFPSSPVPLSKTIENPVPDDAAKETQVEAIINNTVEYVMTSLLFIYPLYNRLQIAIFKYEIYLILQNMQKQVDRLLTHRGKLFNI